MNAGPGWRFDSGAWNVHLNQANCTSAPSALGLASADLGFTDGTGTLKIPDIGLAMGLVGRLTDASNFWLCYVLSGSNVLRLYRVQAGTFNVEVNVPTNFTNGDTIEMSFVGDKITITHGLNTDNTTNSFNNTATRWGIYSEGPGRTVDDFQVDL
jgi:hypothetical protein